MGNGASWLILQIEMGHLGGWGTWPMGYMGNGTHGHNLGHMGNGKHGQRGIMVNTADRDGAPWWMGTWVMRHMANGAHGYNLGHMGNGKHGQRGSWLILQIEMGHLGGWGT